MHYIRTFGLLAFALMLFSNCKQDLALPSSKSNLSFYINNGNEEPLEAITLANGNTAMVGVTSRNKAFLLLLTPEHLKINYIENEVMDRTAFIRVMETADNGILALGVTSNDVAFPTEYGVLNKYNQQGELLWSKTAPRGVLYISMLNLPNGNVLLSGENGDLGGIWEMDNNGTVLWSETYVGYPTGWTNIHSVNQLPNGNYLLTGACNEKNTFSSGSLGGQTQPGQTLLLEIDLDTKYEVNRNIFGVFDRYDRVTVVVANSLIGILFNKDRQLSFFSGRKDLMLCNLDLELSVEKNYGIGNAQFYRNNNDLFIIGSFIVGTNFGETSAVVSKLSSDFNVEWQSVFGASFTPQKAISLTKKLENWQVIATSFDRDEENISFGFYSVNSKGELVQ